MRRFSIDDVVFSAQAACVLEASIDKPGNVGPSHDFDDTRFEDFIISGISMGNAVKRAVEFGILYENGQKGVGGLICTAVDDAARRHRGKNTILGIAMLLIPLSASCGICIKNNNFSLSAIRKGVGKVIVGSTPEDTIDLYQAIQISDAEVGKSDRFDVKDPMSKKRVLRKGLNLQDIFRLSKWDTIARELTSELEITFMIGHPSLKSEFKRTKDLKKSILKCFFEILSKVPDTLIERKNSKETAIEVSNEARAILENGLTPKDLACFNEKLRCDGNKYNPGTTADLTAASIMVSILDGILS
jgi:triphosphoribosyl-dephospho-CoA synthase